MATHRYDIRFLRADGCPKAVVVDMARHDSATLLRFISDQKCARDHFRAATFLGKHPPTMERWATFLVGAMVVRHTVLPDSFGDELRTSRSFAEEA